MKRIVVAVLITALILSVCSCNRGNGTDTPVSTSALTDRAAASDTGGQTLPGDETNVTDVLTETETSAPDFNGEPYSVISTAVAASAEHSGEIKFYEDRTYTSETVTVSSELGVRAKTKAVERGTFETSDGVNLLCSVSEITLYITFDSEEDREIAFDALDFLLSIKIIDYDYYCSYDRSCEYDGYTAPVEEALYDPFLSSFVNENGTKMLLDKDKKLAYDVNVTYDLPDRRYRIEDEGCTVTLDPDGKTGECTLEFVLSGDNKDGLGTYSDITVLKGTYVRNGNSITCRINGELTKLKYDSEESQKQYIKKLEEDFAAGIIIEEVYNYNKAVASDEGRYLDYGDTPDEYGIYVIDVTHAAVFTYTPSQEYYE